MFKLIESIHNPPKIFVQHFTFQEKVLRFARDKIGFKFRKFSIENCRFTASFTEKGLFRKTYDFSYLDAGSLFTTCRHCLVSPKKKWYPHDT